MPTSRDHDLVLFGVTGFTGKLVAEYLLEKNYPIKWAVCGRNEEKIKDVMANLGGENTNASTIPIEIADLVGDEDKLRSVVKKAKVVLTCAGPFEKYGQTLLKFCVEEGTHYADITGESDFVRASVDKYHVLARKNGASIVHHCGNDCIPWDMSVYMMEKFAKNKCGASLLACKTFTELPPSFAASGGTLTTAIYQLSKPRDKKKPDGGSTFDPLVLSDTNEKSLFQMTNSSPKSSVSCPEFDGRSGGPWIMAPVMANCVRRSNALLGYNSSFTYSECQLAFDSTMAYIRQMGFNTLVGLSMYVSFFQRFLNQPGEGPSREDMENGWLKVHGRGTAQKEDGSLVKLNSVYTFTKDTGYLQTAHMLVECGLLLIQSDACTRGVVTPAVAFGEEIVGRLEKNIGAKLEIEEVA